MKKNEKKFDIRMDVLKKFIDMDRKSMQAEANYVESHAEIDSNKHIGKISYYSGGSLETRYYKICGNRIYKAEESRGKEISPYICQGEFTFGDALENEKKESGWFETALKVIKFTLGLNFLILLYVIGSNYKQQQSIEDIEKETNIDGNICQEEELSFVAESPSEQIIEKVTNLTTIHSLEDEISNAKYSDVDLESLIAAQKSSTQGYTLNLKPELPPHVKN